MPANPRQLLQIALAAHQRNQLPQAEALYRQLLAQDANQVDGLRHLALLCHQTGRHEEAVQLVQRSIARSPIPHSYNTLGEALRALERFEASESAYRTAIKLKPDFPEAWNNLATALQQQERVAEAIKAYERAIGLRPDYFRAYANLGTVYLAQGDFARAEQHLRKSISISPQFPPAHSALAEALAKQGKPSEALAAHQTAIRMNPNDPDLIDAFARTLRHLNQLSQAIEAYRAAIRFRPTDPRLHVNLGESLHHAGQVAGAVESLSRALELNPNQPEAHNNLATALTALGQHERAIDHLRSALRINPSYAPAHSNLLLHLHYLPHDPHEIFQEHLRWAAQHTAHVGAALAGAPTTPTTPAAKAAPTRIRLAFTSPDLWRHPVAYFLEPFLQHHDRSRCELFIYSDTVHTDDVTARLRTHVDHWLDTRAFTDEQLYQRIKSDHIDILIDLTSHTAANRLLVFARKSAPVQATYLGYPDTTGLKQIDYRITDTIADPADAEEFHAEKLLRLPHCFLCYAPPPDAPPVGPLPALSNGYITFGSFNRIAKISPDCLRLWSRVLKAVPDSRLLIKSTYLADEPTRDQVRRYFLSHEIPAERLIIQPPVQGFGNHLASYNQIDISLDTFPYNGTTTTCESLWMGVPVLTLPGQTHVSRVGASLLTNANLPELIAGTADDFVYLAKQLASDTARLGTLRSTLRDRLRGWPLLDAPNFTRGFESLLLATLNPKP